MANLLAVHSYIFYAVTIATACIHYVLYPLKLYMIIHTWLFVVYLDGTV